MRFAVLAAVAALGISAPVRAATWLFEVSGDFSYQLVESLNVGNPGGIPQVTFTSGIERATYRVYTYADPGHDTQGIDVYEGGLVGKRADVGRNQGFYTTWKIKDGVLALFESAYFSANDFANSPCAGSPGPIGCYNFNVNATARNLSYRFVSSYDGPGPVPEPATWAMMIGGFGMVGGSMRYRRRKMTVAFA